MELNNLKVTSKNILLIGILFLVLPNVSALIINEIMYNPSSSQGDDDYNEWIEIYNDGNSDVDLSGWFLCGKEILAGYFDNTDDQIKLDSGMVLSAGSYALITEGKDDSGTEVYGNFNIDGNSLALHVDAKSLCGGLSNTAGKTVDLEDSINSTIDSIIYDPTIGANGDGNSLQLCGSSWAATSPTPGSSNSCSTPNPQNQTQENQTQTNTSQTNNQTEESANISTSENNTSNNVVKTEPKLSSTGNTIKEDEVIVLNSLDTKDINNEESAKKSDKSNYAKYILTAFVFLLALLFLLKGKIFKKEYKNEFKK